MGSFAALYEELCRKFPDNKPRGGAFEEICQHYLRTHPAYQKELKTVWLWDEWVSEQRKAYGRGDLSAERITRLEAVDGWVWKVS